MKNRKQQVLVGAVSICVLVIAAGVFGGCGGSTVTSTTVEGTTSSTAVETSSTSQQPVSLPGGFKMAIDATGTRTDGSWVQAMYEGYLALKQKYPDAVFSFSDNIAYNDYPQVLTRQGAEGFNIIYMDNPWYEAVKAVAPKYPKTLFVIAELSEDKLRGLPNNVTSYYTAYHESSYLAGIAAGMVTKTNKIGAVLGVTGYPDLNSSAYAFFEGAKSVNPQVQFKVAITGDWVDQQKGYDTANSLIESGADVIMHFTDNAGLGVIKAATEHGIFVVGEARDQSDLAPKNVITSFLVPHGLMQERAITDYVNGTVTKTVKWFDFHDVELLAPLRNVGDDVKAKVEEAKKGILDGSLKVVAHNAPNALDEFLTK